MEIRPIHNDEDHRAALDEMRVLWTAEPGSPEEARLDVLATLVDAYERTRWPVEMLDPVETIRATMEAQGRTQADLGKLIGPNRASEILNKDRALNLKQIRKLESAWHIPASLLVREYELRS